MAPRFARRRWRRPERMTLDHTPVFRRKNLGPPDVLTLETDLERQWTRRRVTAMIAVYLGAAGAEGLVIGWPLGAPWVAVCFLALAAAYAAALRIFGGRWLVRAFGAEAARNPRLNRYGNNLAVVTGMTPPEVLIVRSDRPNALAVGLRPPAIVATTGSLNIEDLTLEALIAHEIVHLRDGDAMLSSLFIGLTSAPDLLRRNAAASPFLALVAAALLPAATLVRALRPLWFAADHEHRADVAAAILTRYPPGLATALRAAGGAKTPGPRAAAAFWFAPKGDERARLIEEM